MARRAGTQHQHGQSPRCEYRACTARCLERCLHVGPPAQTEIKLLLQTWRVLPKRSICFPDLSCQPLLLQKLHHWLFLLSVLSACTQAGSEHCPCIAPWKSLCEKLTAHLWEERLPSLTRRFPLPEQKRPPPPGELEGAAWWMLCFEAFKISIISSLKEITGLMHGAG